MSARDGTPASIAARSRAALSAAEVTGTPPEVTPPEVTGELFVRVNDRPAEADLAVVDPDVEPTFRIITHPGLVRNRRPIAPIVAEGQ
jgi:hypothetical protein